MNSVANFRYPIQQIQQPQQSKFSLSEIACLVILFLLSLGIRYWYNFVSPHINDYAVGDAYEYMRSASALLNLRLLQPSFWHQAGEVLLGGASSNTISYVQQTFAPLKNLAISGPVYPIFLTICYLFNLSTFSIDNWMPPVFGQCIISALTCVFAALIGRYTINKRTGLIAGTLCAVYPGFIVNSNRLYSETLGAFLLCLICFLTVKRFAQQQNTASTIVNSLVYGFLAACLQLTRSIMAMLTIALIPVILFQQGLRKGILALSMFMVGFVLVAIPWLIFQKSAFGSASLVVDRAGHYNCSIGNCIETAGWLSYPYPDLAQAEHSSFPRIIWKNFQTSHSRWLKLMQDKPIRLLKLPWNDFRKPIGPVSFRWQALFHQAIVLLAAIGLVLGLARIDSGDRRKLASLAFLMFAIALHFIYLFFITIPRYNLTAIPLIIVFAAIGIDSIILLARQRATLSTSLCLSAAAMNLLLTVRTSVLPWTTKLAGSNCAVVGLVTQLALSCLAVGLLSFFLWKAILLFSVKVTSDTSLRLNTRLGLMALGCLVLISVPALILPAEANGRFMEWKTELMPSQIISQEFRLPAALTAPTRQRQFYILIDSDSPIPLQSAAVKVNGVPLNYPFMPSISLCDFAHFQNLPSGFMRESEWIFGCLTAPSGIANSDLRQWFVMPIPSYLVNGKESMLIEIKNESRHCKPVVYGSYETGKKFIEIPCPWLYSWEKAFYGVENDNGFSDTRFNTKILGQYSKSYRTDLSTSPGMQTGRYNIHLLAGPSLPASKSPYLIPLSRLHLDPATIDGQSPTFSCSQKNLPKPHKDDWWIIRLRGMAKCNDSASQLAIQPKVDLATSDKAVNSPTCLTRNWGDPAAEYPDATKPYISPWTSKIPLTQEWQTIDLAIPIKPSSFGAPMKDISYDFHLSSASNLPQNKYQALEMKNLVVEILRLPNSPIGPGFEIY